ncbi:MAG: L,D-transpeptidase [Flavipsychrobacter sp.]|nr:L,D-transpeptidase [Flavipsychrobacter sp.]
MNKRFAIAFRIWVAIAICCTIILTWNTTLAQQRKPTVPPGEEKAMVAPIKNLKLLNEYKDVKGNLVRIVQYTQGNNRVTETIVMPPRPAYVHVPIRVDTMNKDSVMVVVDKGHYNLQVYYRHRLIRTYKAVFGPKPLENKICEGDRCTPEGWFKIANKNPASKYHRFMGLNYPNDSAIARFNKMKAKGLLPANARIGGDVGIHGIWANGDDMIEMGIGWTDGCVAIKNNDIEDLYSMVGVGTRVLIRR